MKLFSTTVFICLIASVATGCAGDTKTRFAPTYGSAIPQTSSVGRPVYRDPIHDCQRSVYDTHGVACAGN